jgi:DNA-binding MarR family transcriptional regulator
MQLHRSYTTVVTPADPCNAMLARRFARRVTAIYDEALAVHGLTIGQFGILGHLRRREPVGIAALAERLSSDASTLSRLLKPLAAAGLISVERDTADGRAKALRLTDAGLDRARAAKAAWLDAQAAVSERLGAERVAALRFILNDAYALL